MDANKSELDQDAQGLCSNTVFKVPVNFVHNGIESLRHLVDDCSINIIDHPSFYKNITGGVNNWILQTYIRLKERGHPVSINDHFIPHMINVAHYDTIKPNVALINYFIVSIRADRDPAFIANMEVVQCAGTNSRPYISYIPHWPQPGIIKRDLQRKSKVKNVVFMGAKQNLAAAFRSGEFKKKLERIGVTFQLEQSSWWDYSQADIVLAVRDGDDFFLSSKPASKLINAWLAGCPALLGPEPAYKRAGLIGQNYIEVANTEQAVEAITRLRDDPEFFERLVSSGREAVLEYSVQKTTDKWEDFFAGPAASSYFSWERKYLFQYLTRVFRYYYRLSRRRLWGYQCYQGVDEKGSLQKKTVIGNIRRKIFKI